MINNLKRRLRSDNSPFIENSADYNDFMDSLIHLPICLEFQTDFPVDCKDKLCFFFIINSCFTWNN